MRLRELCPVEPDQDEIRNIKLDDELKKRPNVKKMRAVAMPGNDSTYPAL